MLCAHSAKIKPPTIAKTAVIPTLTEVEMPLLLLLELSVLVEVEAESVPVAAPVAPPVEPAPELPLGVVELESEFSALFRKAAKVLFAFALTAKTIPCLQ